LLQTEGGLSAQRELFTSHTLDSADIMLICCWIWEKYSCRQVQAQRMLLKYILYINIYI